MLWVKGAPVRRGILPRCTGVLSGEGALGRQEWGLGSGSHHQSLEGMKVGAAPRPPFLPWELVEVMSSSRLAQPPSALTAARTR